MNQQVMHIVAYVVGAVGFVAGLIAIYNFIIRPSDPEKILLTPQSEMIVLSSSTLENNRPIVGDEVVIGKELVTDNAIYIVANHLLFGESSSLKAPEIVIFATRITRGNLDVSGEDATLIGDLGTGGGSIFVATARLDGTLLDSSGGNGAKGEDGGDGTPGRNGRCDRSRLLGGRGWVAASDGGDGNDGGNGGNGGAGGRITMLVSNMDGFPDPIVAGGHGGDRGTGGSGGSGGSGCTGFGGIQEPHPPGLDGDDGMAGQSGASGKLVRRKVHFKDIKRAMKDVDLTNNKMHVDVLKDIRNQLERVQM